jgi:hypothetical protein
LAILELTLMPRVVTGGAEPVDIALDTVEPMVLTPRVADWVVAFAGDP